MKTFTKLMVLIALAMGMVSPQAARASKTEVEALLKEGGIFRIKNRGSNNYLTEIASNNGLMGKALLKKQPAHLSQVWIVARNSKGYTLRNASTGRYVPAKDGNPMTTTFGAGQFYIRYSQANSGTSTDFITISWNEKFEKNESLNENNGTHNVLGWKANSPSVNDNFSDWSLEQVSDVSTADIKAHLDANSGAVEATDGAYVRVMNMMYGTYMTEASAGHTLSCVANDANDYGQVWQLTKRDDKWQLKNVLTDRYIQLQSGARSQQYKTITTATAWKLTPGVDTYLTTYGFEDAAGIGLHCDAQSKVVGWDVAHTPSQWMLKAAAIDEAALTAAKERLAAYAVLTGSNVLKIRNTLKAYFEDLACTKLKPEFQAMSDADLVAFMSKSPEAGTAFTIALPSFFQDIVLKVKNNTWTHREKEFRIYDYQPYSAYDEWNSNHLMGTGYPFSPQTGPTGVSAKRNDILFVFVGSSIPAGTTLEAMTCVGMDIWGKRTTLQPGLNVLNVDVDCHVFINYNVKNYSKKLADVPALPIHIEGGYVNGYFDITRGHTNADWLDMEKTLFKDEVIHLKNKWTQFNMLLDGVKKQINYSQMTQVDTDGTPKGIEGTLRRWDQLLEWERELIGAPRFYDRFNCMLSASASSSGNPYASNHGTFYPGVGEYMNYNWMTFGTENDEGRGMWVVAHEVGHTNQRLINLPGDTEMSVNFFSQVVRWNQGSNVGRGGPLSVAMASFHKGQYHHEYDIWLRSRMYFQLWLYYELMGHRKGFWPAVCDMMRKQPMEMSRSKENPMSGKFSYFRFAQYCADAAQEDLSEFFEFYGFFKEMKNHEVGDYSNTYFTTTKAEIEACKQYMSKYPKAHPGLIFIDERIRKSPANYPGMRKGAMRLATSASATPGVAAEVGNVGMVDDFRQDLETKPYTATLSGNTVTIKTDGKGAVGFKVYDTTGKLVYVANTYRFTIPTEIAKHGYYVSVAYGNGKEASVLDKTGITAIDAAPAVDAAKTEEVIYDLDGRRSQGRNHGVQIVNGKVTIN